MIYLILAILMSLSSLRSSPTPTPRCSCLPPSSCSTQLYGRLPQDIALLGLHAPCPTHGLVLCCDRKGLEHLYQDSILPVVISQVTGAVKVIGSVQVTDPGQVTGPVQVTGSVQVTDPGQVTGPDQVTGSVQVTDPGQVTGPDQVTGSVQVTSPVQVSGTPSESEVDVSVPSPCSCVSSSSCSTQLYGTLPEDIAVLGLYPHCPTHGEVLCCDRNEVEQSDREGGGQSEGQETDSSEDEADSTESGNTTGVAKSMIVKCGCIPHGICFEQFIRETDDPDQCRGQVGLELCCVPGEDQDSEEGGVAYSDEGEIAESDEGEVANVHHNTVEDKLKVKPTEINEETLEVAESDDNEEEQGKSLDQQLKAVVESTNKDTNTDQTNLTNAVTIHQAPDVSADRYSLSCVAVSLCKQEYSLTARDIAKYGVMPGCVYPLVRCVQQALEEQSGGAVVGPTKEVESSNEKSTVHKSIGSRNLEMKDKKKTPLFTLLKSRKVVGKKEEDVKQPGNVNETSYTPSSTQRLSTQRSDFQRQFFQSLNTKRPTILRSSSQRQSILRTSSPSNAWRIDIQRSSPPTPRPVPILNTISSNVLSIPVPSTSPPSAAEQQSQSLTPASPPSLTLVPCTQPCPGTAYSPLSTLHRQLYGELAECSPGLVRCVLHLDMQIFKHKDNFNLPIFNVKNFFSFLSDSNSGESSDDQESEVEQNDDSNADGLIEEASVPDIPVVNPVQTLQVSPATSAQSQVNNSSHLAGGGSIPSVMEEIKDEPDLTSRRSFFERPKTMSNSASRPPTLPSIGYPALGSNVGSLRVKQILGNRNKQIQRQKPVRFLDELRDKLINKKTSSTFTTLLPSTAQELLSRKSHLPDVGEITGVEIVMPTHQMAKVMLHMDKDMMEVKLEDEQLLPVLQALINALAEI